MTIPLPAPTADSRVLVHWALRALERIFRPGYAYKKAGVMLAGIQPERIRQGTLFDGVESSERSGKVMAVMDSINEKWGRDVIKPAAVRKSPSWQMRRERCSPRYTTSWDELPKVLAK